MWFQRLSGVIRYIDSEYEVLTIYSKFWMLFNIKNLRIKVFVEMCFQRLSGVIGYIDSEYDSVNNI